MNSYEISFISSYLFNGIILMVLSLFVLSRNYLNKVNTVFASYSFAIAWWSFFSVFMLFSKTEAQATFWDRICLIGVIFIPSTFIHFTYVLLGLEEAFRNRIKIFYGTSLLFLVLNFTPFFIKKTQPIYKLKYFTVPDIGYYVFLFFYSLVIIYGLLILLNALLKAKQTLRRMQLTYLFVFTLLGYLGGALNFNLVLNMPPYDLVPYGNALIGIYALGVVYSIIKHRLMDISIIFTRATIFILVYSIILGIPFALAFGAQYKLISLLGVYWWLVPLVFSTTLATIGPLVYFHFQKKAEERLLEEQHRYQETIKLLSTGLGRIRNLDGILKLMIYVLTRAVRVGSCTVYFARSDDDRYQIGALQMPSKGETFPQQYIRFDSALVKYLYQINGVLITEEIKQRAREFPNNTMLDDVAKELTALNAAMVAPSFIEDRIIAITIIGQKRSKEIFSNEDLSVFTVLANQAGLAIENAFSLENMQKTQQQLFKAEKMATIGTMADGISHQINNRLHAMGFITSDALDTLNMIDENTIPDHLKEVVDDLKFSLDRVQQNVKQGGEIVSGLLKYTRKSEEGFESFSFQDLIAATYEIVKYKFKMPFDIVYEISDNLPPIYANYTQLQEVFLNLLDNGYDATVMRKEELNEKSYKGKLYIRGKVSEEGQIQLEVEDNGLGVKDEDKHKLFTPFFTTKVTSKKGTGLGLYVIQKIIEEGHFGNVKFDSVYKQGTRVEIVLPISFEEVKKD